VQCSASKRMLVWDLLDRQGFASVAFWHLSLPGRFQARGALKGVTRGDSIASRFCIIYEGKQ
jgi:hypothetical protein